MSMASAISGIVMPGRSFTSAKASFEREPEPFGRPRPRPSPPPEELRRDVLRLLAAALQRAEGRLELALLGLERLELAGDA